MVPIPLQKYMFGGLIYHKQSSRPAEGFVLQLDNNPSFTVNGMIAGSGCNFYFPNTTAGLHRLRITSPTTLPLDTNIIVDHDAACFGPAYSETYRIPITLGLINTGREFIIPQGIGTTWSYAFEDSYWSVAFSQDVHGIHTWQLTSVNTQATGTTLNIIDIRNDTTKIDYFYGQGPDLTFTQIDTVFFPIIISSASIAINCPEIGVVVDTSFRTIPRYCIQSTDTISFKDIDLYRAQPSFFLQYINHIGISEYFRTIGANTRYTNSFKLIQCIQR